MQNTRRIGFGKLVGFVAAAALGFIALPAHAQQYYQITLDTSSLAGLGTYYAEFSLEDGSNPGNGNAQAIIQDFQVNGGTLGAVLPPTTGNVTGQLGAASTLTLANTDPGGLEDFAQAFTVTNSTSSIVFNLGLSNLATDTPIPDNFTMQLLDSSLNAIPTTGLTGTEIVDAPLTSSAPVPTVYTSTGSQTPAISGSASAISTPEQGSMPLLAVGGICLIGVLGWKARRPSAAR